MLKLMPLSLWYTSSVSHLNNGYEPKEQEDTMSLQELYVCALFVHLVWEMLSDLQ